MESSSPTIPPVYHLAASSTHSQTVEDKVEVQALNKKLRGETPEETRKMLPDYQATSDSNQSRAFASLKTSLSSNTRASVSQKKAELTDAEKIFSGQFPGTNLPHSLKLIPERSEQETSKSEQPTEIPDVVAFRNKQSFFEDQIKQKIEKNTALHKEHRASHTSIHNYQPGKVSAESKWMTNPHNYSHHTPAGCEQELHSLIQTSPSSASISNPPPSQQHQLLEASTIGRQKKAPPGPPERKSSLSTQPQHLETTATTKSHIKTQSDDRATRVQALEQDVEKAVADMNKQLEQLGFS